MKFIPGFTSQKSTHVGIAPYACCHYHGTSGNTDTSQNLHKKFKIKNFPYIYLEEYYAIDGKIFKVFLYPIRDIKTLWCILQNEKCVNNLSVYPNTLKNTDNLRSFGRISYVLLS